VQYTAAQQDGDPGRSALGTGADIFPAGNLNPGGSRLVRAGEKPEPDPNMRTKIPNGATVTRLLPVMALALAGCWTAPIANVQPKGEARLIQRAIPVESVKDRATVQSIDANQRVIVLKFSEGASATFKPGPQVAGFYQIRAGDNVRATVAQELTVYVLKSGQLPGAGGKAETIKADAKVLMVDPSYRLLTLQYPNGQAETFKVGLEVKLLEMEAGDDVVVRTMDLVALRVEKP
jgi:hypothetical protein